MNNKYVHNTDLSVKPYDTSITVNTRTGGSYLSSYALPTPKINIGEVGINFYMDNLNVYCPSIERDEYLPIQGNVINTHTLSSYTLYCVLGDTKYPLEVNISNNWSFNVPSRTLYDLSVTDINLLIEGFDEKGNVFTLTNSLPVNVEKGCIKVECSQNTDSVSFNYYHNEVYTPVFRITVNGYTETANGILELEEICKRNSLELKVYKDD